MVWNFDYEVNYCKSTQQNARKPWRVRAPRHRHGDPLRRVGGGGWNRGGCLQVLVLRVCVPIIHICRRLVFLRHVVNRRGVFLPGLLAIQIPVWVQIGFLCRDGLPGLNCTADPCLVQFDFLCWGGWGSSPEFLSHKAFAGRETISGVASLVWLGRAHCSKRRIISARNSSSRPCSNSAS